MTTQTELQHVIQHVIRETKNLRPIYRREFGSYGEVELNIIYIGLVRVWHYQPPLFLSLDDDKCIKIDNEHPITTTLSQFKRMRGYSAQDPGFKFQMIDSHHDQIQMSGILCYLIIVIALEVPILICVNIIRTVVEGR